ncbi:MAG: PilZ domain-containing protein [Gammaproteobacteria bacterium]|nr:PilZ domain-containing protein [Gammaproteobacteria bacterium]
MSNIPVRLRCMQSPDSGCRCLGRIESVSASGALIRTELGICPAARMMVETLTPALGLEDRELPACVVRVRPGEIAVEWTEFASTSAFAVMTETMLNGGASDAAEQVSALGRVPFCALAAVS